MLKGLSQQIDEFINNPEVLISTAQGPCSMLMQGAPRNLSRPGPAPQRWQTPNCDPELAPGGEHSAGPRGPCRAQSLWGQGPQINGWGCGVDTGEPRGLPPALTVVGAGALVLLSRAEEGHGRRNSFLHATIHSSTDVHGPPRVWGTAASEVLAGVPGEPPDPGAGAGGPAGRSLTSELPLSTD